ncbi:MAG: putative metal-binding motif-containing protein, partial [Myxococcaceae bacterium]
MLRTSGSRVVAAAIGAYLAAGCTPAPSSAISVTIEVDPAVKSTCFQVVAKRAAGGPEVLSDSTLKKGRIELAFYSSAQLWGAVAFQARGFLGSGCDEPRLLNDESPVEIATFSRDEIRRVVLKVLPAGPEADTDRDGYRAASAAGPDCADDDAAVHPGAGELCEDQRDNDCDSSVDCADPSCEGASCSDGQLCTSGDRCLADGQCAGAAMSCDPPGSTMCAGARVCSPSSGACVLTGTVQTCDDGVPCTTADQCLEDGGCRGTAVECLSPPGQCLAAIGSCEGGGACRYPLNAVRLFLPCDGGVCWPDGGCALPAFPYPPSNFDPSSLSASSIAPDVTLNCAADFDSTPDASTPFVSWCGQTQPEVLVVPQDGGPDAVLLAMYRFNLDPAGVLRVHGTRPVIFGVYDSARLSGRLLAAANLATPGPGGSTGACGASSGLAGSVSGGRSGGGGGAGFGSQGGEGGAANAVAATSGAPGASGGTSELVPLRGGCPGGAGGTASAQAGAGGAGGGALQLSV